MDDHTAVVEIAAQLIASPGSTAPQLALALGFNKKQVNRVLYRRHELFVNLGGQPPQWAVDVEQHRTAVTGTDPARTTEPTNQQDLYPWQHEALAAWRTAGRRGIVEAVTGAGKTRLAMAAIDEELLGGGKVAVLVPSIELQRQWAELLEQRFPEVAIGGMGGGRHDDLRSVTVVVAVGRSAAKNLLGLQDGERGLLVADECHRYGAEQQQLALEIAFEARLGLSATYARMDGAHETVLEPYFDGVAYRLDYRRAIDDDAVAHVKVAAIGVDFTPAEAAAWEQLSEDYRQAKTRLIADFDVPTEPFDAFLGAVNRLAKEGTRREGMAAHKFLKAFTGRRKVLAGAAAKLDALALISPALDDANRTLLFTRTIEAAEKASAELEELGAHAEVYHSKLKAHERREVLLRFSTEDLVALVAVEALDEGVDVPEADLAVILAATQQRRQMVQRMGRVMRRKQDGRPARFVIVYVRGTSEDPERGAHEAFFNEIIEVADEVATFDSSSPPSEIRRFLAPHAV